MKLNRFLWVLLPVLFTMQSCTIGRMVIYQFSDIRDHKKFPKRDLVPSAEPFRFFEGNKAAFLAKDIRVTHDNRHEYLDTLLMNSNTVAFLVIQKDSILYERYLHKYEADDVVPSFSMAKSFTSALVGIAIAEGKIKSVDDPITDYLTEMPDSFKNVKVRHLLEMTSGFKNVENYFNPFAGVAKLYYGKRLHKVPKYVKQEYPGGHSFEYLSLNTQLLGEIVVRATGKSMTDYLQEKLWTPMGMEYDASWSIDQNKDGMEKAFCCINAAALDFAKFGRLYLNNGNWNGQQLIPEEWVMESTKVNAKDGSSTRYQYQWWLPSKDGDYSAIGHLGQFIYVNPMKKVIIVRLGKNEGDVHWTKAFREIADQL